MEAIDGDRGDGDRDRVGGDDYHGRDKSDDEKESRERFENMEGKRDGKKMSKKRR